MATFTETWLELLEVLKEKDKRQFNNDPRTAMTRYCMDELGNGCEYKVIGTDKILVTMIYGFVRDKANAQVYNMEDIRSVYGMLPEPVDYLVFDHDSDHEGSVSSF